MRELLWYCRDNIITNYLASCFLGPICRAGKSTVRGTISSSLLEASRTWVFSRDSWRRSDFAIFSPALLPPARALRQACLTPGRLFMSDISSPPLFCSLYFLKTLNYSSHSLSTLPPVWAYRWYLIKNTGSGPTYTITKLKQVFSSLFLCFHNYHNLLVV